jgi:hypothetical protein
MLLVQLIANDTDPSDLQIVSFNPGSILSESARNVGFDESSFDWDDGNALSLSLSFSLCFLWLRVRLLTSSTRKPPRPVRCLVCD